MQRLKRVFHINIEHCGVCGGTLRVIACIETPEVIERILTTSPPATPAASTTPAHRRSMRLRLATTPSGTSTFDAHPSAIYSDIDVVPERFRPCANAN